MKDILKSLSDLALLIVAAASVYFWLTYSQNAFVKQRDACAVEADKIFAVEIVRWQETNKTNVNNPFRRARDQRVEDCLSKSGKWCVWDWSDRQDIWPVTWADAFAPREDIARRLYQWLYLRPSNGRNIKCVN